MEGKTPNPYRHSRRRPELDPCCDYILFEAAKPGHVDWKPITSTLNAWRQAILEQRMHHDPLSGTAQLLVKLDPQKGEYVRRAVLAMKPRSDIVVCFYNRPPQARATPASLPEAGKTPETG